MLLCDGSWCGACVQINAQATARITVIASMGTVSAMRVGMVWIAPTVRVRSRFVGSVVSVQWNAAVLCFSVPVSCPGDYCHYDNVTLIQHCTHCCHASYEHSDGELYIPNERKVACDAQHPGESHGICDGFGFCQCAPPFIGEDCSISTCL
jgi:hypothetical protein